MARPDLAARLLATFSAELEEQVGGMNADLLALEAGDADPARVRSLFRAAHTLKGAARAASISAVEQVCHEMETLLARARDRGAGCEPGALAALFTAVDAVSAAGRRLRAREPVDEPALAAALRALRTPAAAYAGATLHPPGVEASAASIEPPVPATGTAESAVPPTESVTPPASPAAGGGATPGAPTHVWVASEDLDALVAATGELVITTGAVSARWDELRALRQAARGARSWRERRPFRRPFARCTGALTLRLPQWTRMPAPWFRRQTR